MLTDYMCQEKREEEDLQILTILLMHLCNELKTTYQNVEDDGLQPP